MKKNNKKKNGTRIKEKCKSCGYSFVHLYKEGCPMCKPCPRCKSKLVDCKCIEGE